MKCSHMCDANAVDLQPMIPAIDASFCFKYIPRAASDAVNALRIALVLLRDTRTSTTSRLNVELKTYPIKPMIPTMQQNKCALARMPVLSRLEDPPVERTGSPTWHCSCASHGKNVACVILATAAASQTHQSGPSVSPNATLRKTYQLLTPLTKTRLLLHTQNPATEGFFHKRSCNRKNARRQQNKPTKTRKTRKEFGGKFSDIQNRNCGVVS